MNEVPQLVSHHIFRPQGAFPSVGIRESAPIVADADNGIGIVNPVNENVIFHLISLSRPAPGAKKGRRNVAGLSLAFELHYSTRRRGAGQRERTLTYLKADRACAGGCRPFPPLVVFIALW